MRPYFSPLQRRPGARWKCLLKKRKLGGRAPRGRRRAGAGGGRRDGGGGRRRRTHEFVYGRIGGARAALTGAGSYAGLRNRCRWGGRRRRPTTVSVRASAASSADGLRRSRRPRPTPTLSRTQWIAE
ncbi:hypothetical protein EVAR_79085_1 [Eumeta japonica]|uniref:Uncharacterized protein n=1 Tax=Eumeta variegata TaxID=151549 RepID=A0A4C1X3K0_EUMVA|nr:hypothetical protein EVAR_79085_1 [Eumeta japonica]